MITRSFANNFAVQDWTEELQMVPNIRTPLSDLGIFRQEAISQTTVAFEQTFGTLGLIGDVTRGGSVLANKDESRKIHTYQVPYHKVIDYLTQADVQGQRAYGSADQADTKAAVLERKMIRMKRSALMTEEYAKFYALTQGKIWSPNGTVAHNSFYADFGVTRKEVAFDLTNATTDVIAKVEEIIAHIQDNSLSGDTYTGVVALCSPEFFSALIAQAGVKEAYKFYSSTQEPLRNRLGGNTTLYREFVYAGCLFREIRDGVNGQRFIPANDAYFVPTGTEDTFISYVAPSSKLNLANTLGENQYLWVYPDFKGEKEEMELEFSHVHLLRRPQAVVRAVKGNTV
jgi:hypothetical protein